MNSVRTTQPIHRVPLTQRYAKGLRFLSLPGIPGYLEIGTQAYATYPPQLGNSLNTSNPRIGSRSGRAAVVDGTTSSIQFARVGSLESYTEIPSGADWTFLVSADAVDYTGANPGFWRCASGSGTTFCILNSTGMWIRCNGTDITGSKGQPPIGSTVQAVYSIRSGLWATGAVNGVLHINQSTAATTEAMTGTNGINLWGNQSGSDRIYGNYTLLGMLGFAVGPQEAIALSLNPWQIFEPELRRTYFVPAAAQTLWAQSAL